MKMIELSRQHTKLIIFIPEKDGATKGELWGSDRGGVKEI